MSEAINPNLVLGTAGHIDHGKSALVMALTGKDPDTLEEEKKRGITIELGWAQLELPDGRKMTVVDVPGHEKFVRQMIVGAAGIDVALLVIAADDGVMPQTVEHVAVLQTLGIETCVVALTKIDLVDDDWVDLVKEDIRTFLQNTPYADARIVPCSNRTGEGVEDVRRAIAEACDEAPTPHRIAAMRQPVHHVFSVKGVGTVVTGVVWSGAARIDDVVEVVSSGKKGRIRTIQVHGEAKEEAFAGNCVAMGLGDLKKSDVKTGDFIATPGAVRMTDRFDCYFTYIDTSGVGIPLVSGTQMHVAHGSKEVLGRVLFADEQVQLGSGQSCYAQIRLEEPLPVSCYDRFIVRTYSPVRVAGGGQVMYSYPRRRTNLGEDRLVFDALREGRFGDAVVMALGSARFPVTAFEVARLFGTDEASMQATLDEAVSQGRILTLGSSTKYFTTQDMQDEMLGILEGALKEFHEQHPAEPGMKKETLRQQCLPRLDADRFDCLVSLALSLGKVALNKGLVGHASAQEAAGKAHEEALAAIAECLERTAEVPPELAEIAQECKLTMPLARRAMASLCEQGRACRVTGDLFYDAQVMDRMKAAVADLCSREEGAGMGELREAMGISRKRAVPVLEMLDMEGFTVRVDDRRFLK